MEKSNKEFATLIAPQGELTGIFTKITAAVPEGVKVADLGALATHATVTGRAPGPAEVIQFVQTLRAIAGPTGALFSKVEYSQVQSGPLSFTISATRTQAPRAP
jgi:Tfp pilus assembly protein PilN